MMDYFFTESYSDTEDTTYLLFDDKNSTYYLCI